MATMEKSFKPLPGIISRTGGKSRLRKTIIPLIPDHDTYVELFVGGGSIFFGKPVSKKEIVNDLDTDIYNIYRDTKNIGEKIAGLSFIPTRAKFLKLKNTNHFRSPVQRLYRNIYLSRMSFGGNRTSYIGDKAEKGGTFDIIQSKWKTPKYKDRLKDVTIENKDFKVLIKKSDSSSTFFYLDPPYSRADKNKDYLVTGVTIEDVFNAVKNIKGKFLMSYDNVPEALKVFKQFNIIKVGTRYSDGKGGTNLDVCELLIANYPIKIPGQARSCK